MDFDSETLFNTAAAAVATIAVVLFIIDHGFPYSPVSKSMLVLAFVAGVFAVSQATDDDQLTLLGYGVAVVALVALLLDLTGQFNVETPLQVAGLLVLAAGFFGLRTLLGNESRLVSDSRAKQAFAVVTVLAVVVLTVDVVTGGLAYELAYQEEVQMSSGPEVAAEFGAVVVSNSGPFPERVDIPSYSVCTAGDWSAYRPETSDGEQRPVGAHIQIRHGYGDHVFGFGEKRYTAVIQLHAAEAAGEQFLVQRTEGCPSDESGDPYLAVYKRSENAPYRTPV